MDWAEPEVEVDEDTMSSVKILYVRNLMLSTTEETIEKEFNSIKPGRKPLVLCLLNKCCEWKYFCVPKMPKEIKIAGFLLGNVRVKCHKNRHEAEGSHPKCQPIKGCSIPSYSHIEGG